MESITKVDKEDLRRVKASFKDCPISERKLFKNSKCLLTISVGQKAHEDKKFLATINLVNKNFKSCTLLIGDILQRHNLATIYPDLTCEQLYTKAIDDGDKWLKRNKSIYTKLEIPFNIIRWEHYIEKANFKDKLMEIENLYYQNSYYKDAIDITVNKYLQRNIQQNKGLKKETIYSYIKEECAAMIFWTDTCCEFEVYHSGRNEAMACTYEIFIAKKYPQLIKPVSLRFKKY